MKDVVAAHGGTALMNRVGHSFFKRRMRDTNGVFGGEVTGHYYFRDNYFADNGFIPALLILELMSKKGQSLHDLLEPLRSRYFISGEINTGCRRTLSRKKLRLQPGATANVRWTASRWNTPTGTSTSGRRTPSRCCVLTSKPTRRG